MRYRYTGASLGAELTQDEQSWLKQNQPRLFYLHEERKAYGYFSFSMKHENFKKISATYEIAIDFARLEFDYLPYVYEVGGRIRKTAKLYNLPLIDLHQYSNNRLCLMRPDVLIGVFKKNRLSIELYCKILSSYLYWQAHFERYGITPWPGEEHGWDWAKQYINNG